MLLATAWRWLIVPGGCGAGRLCSYNIFGDRDAFDYTDAVPAWQDCLNELDYRRAATGTKDMRLVISMSFGADSTVPTVGQVLQQLAAERGDDVLWIASAGNDGTDIYNYPAAAPEVVSVGERNLLLHVEILTDWIQQCAGPCLG